MNNALRALQFIRLVDEQGNLSLTNVALIVALAKVAMAPQLAIADLAPFIASLVGYNVKRWMSAAPVSAAEDASYLREAVATLQTQVTGLQLGQQRR